MSPSLSHDPLTYPGHPYSTHTILINSLYLLGRSDQKKRFSFDLNSVSSRHDQNLSCLTWAYHFSKFRHEILQNPGAGLPTAWCLDHVGWNCDENSGSHSDVWRTTGACSLSWIISSDFVRLLCDVWPVGTASSSESQLVHRLQFFQSWKQIERIRYDDSTVVWTVPEACETMTVALRNQKQFCDERVQNDNARIAHITSSICRIIHCSVLRRVDSSSLVFNLSSHRHSYIVLVFNSRFIDSRNKVPNDGD